MISHTACQVRPLCVRAGHAAAARKLRRAGSGKLAEPGGSFSSSALPGLWPRFDDRSRATEHGNHSRTSGVDAWPKNRGRRGHIPRRSPEPITTENERSRPDRVGTVPPHFQPGSVPHSSLAQRCGADEELSSLPSSATKSAWRLAPDLLRANCVCTGSRNPLYVFVLQASSRDQPIPSDRDLL